MKSLHILAGLFLLATASGAMFEPDVNAQAATGAALVESKEKLPKDIFPDSRSRLPLVKREDLDERARRPMTTPLPPPASGVPQGVAAIRLHGSGVDVRWESPLGRRLTELAIMATARERDQPYEWSLHEMEALAVGLEPAIIDVVRYRKPLSGVGDKEAAIIQMDREVVGMHKLSSETYARRFETSWRETTLWTSFH